MGSRHAATHEEAHATPAAIAAKHSNHLTVDPSSAFATAPQASNDAG